MDFTPEQLDIIEAQGWNSDSMVTILASKPANVSLTEWLQSWANEENAVDSSADGDWFWDEWSKA